MEKNQTLEIYEFQINIENIANFKNIQLFIIKIIYFKLLEEIEHNKS